MSESLDIFTDGSALKNQNNAPAGWAYYIPLYKHLRSQSMYGTNNQAELTAIKEAISYISSNLGQRVLETISIYSDSTYSIGVVTGSMKASKNLELISEIKILISTLNSAGVNIKFKHVDAHTGKKDYVSVSNDVVDKAARTKANEAKSKRQK